MNQFYLMYLLSQKFLKKQTSKISSYLLKNNIKIDVVSQIKDRYLLILENYQNQSNNCFLLEYNSIFCKMAIKINSKHFCIKKVPQLYNFIRIGRIYSIYQTNTFLLITFYSDQIFMRFQFRDLINISKTSMAQRKIWTPMEDEALRILKDQRKIKKWSKISELLENQFQIYGRNGKQCRQRYHNHLDNSIVREEWSEEENQKLVTLHNKMGNRWASIARALQGRTDNCVKNHFYSQFRKAIRNINDLMKKLGKKFFSPIKTNFIRKIISVVEVQNRKDGQIDENFQQIAEELKQEMLKYSLMRFEEGDIESLNRISSLYEKFQKFNKSFSHFDKRDKKDSPKISTQDIFYQEPQNQESFKNIRQACKRHEILQEESQKSTPQTFDPQELTLRGISSFMDKHLDASQKNIDPSYLNSSLERVPSESKFFDLDKFYAEEIQMNL